MARVAKRQEGQGDRHSMSMCGDMPHDAHSSVQIQGANVPRDLCRHPAQDVWTCAACMVQGHRECLGLTFAAGYPVCHNCAGQAQLAYQRHNAEQQARWQQAMSTQLAQWRQRSLSVTGATATIGITAGAITGAIIAVAAFLAQGAAAGVASAVSQARASRISSPAPLPLPLAPPPGFQ